MIKYFILLFSVLTFFINASAQVVHKKYFDRFTHYDIEDWITYAPASDITSIDVGEDYVYFGTRYGGILRYHLYDNCWDYPFTTSSGLSSNHIKRIVYSYDDHRIYALTDKGIDVYNCAFNYWEPAYTNELPERRTASREDIADFKQQKDYRFPAFYRPPNSALPDFFTDIDFIFRPPNEIVDKQNRIFKLKGERVVDTFRKLWVSTNGLGAGSADLDNLDLSFHPQSISNISPRDILFDDDNIWIVGISSHRDPTGITLWDYEKDTWQYFEAQYNPYIYNDDIYNIAGNKRNIFFGSDYGLIKYDKKKNNWKTFTTLHRLASDKINDLTFFGEILFIATDRGFNWLEPGSKKVRESADLTLNNIPIFKIVALDSFLFMATNSGVFKYFPDKDEISFFTTGSALLDVGITAINIDSDTLWMAGQYGIMYLDPKTDRWFSFTQIQQYVSGSFHDIAFTEGNVWFACDDGLLKYDIKRNYWYLYTVKDGLANNRVFHIDVDNDELWLSTHRGITIFRWHRPGRIE